MVRFPLAGVYPPKRRTQEAYFGPVVARRTCSQSYSFAPPPLPLGVDVPIRPWRMTSRTTFIIALRGEHVSEIQQAGCGIGLASFLYHLWH
jgi:hypothetical protein